MEKKEQLEICCKLLQDLLDTYSVAKFTYELDEDIETVELRFDGNMTNMLEEIVSTATACRLSCAAGVDRDGCLYLDIF